MWQPSTTFCFNSLSSFESKAGTFESGRAMTTPLCSRLSQSFLLTEWHGVKAAIVLTSRVRRGLIDSNRRIPFMSRGVNKWLLVVLLLLPISVAAQEKYIASYAGFAGFQAPLWAAKDFGFLNKYGVNVDLVMIPGSARGAQAMLGGSIHFGQIDGTALISAINQGADLVFVASSLNKFPFSLVAQKNIRQPKDLAGKKVGIVAFGGAHEVSLILALKEWNVPRQSVTLLASGPAANRLLALSSGALDATLLAPPETGEAARMGLPTLGHMTELKAAFFPMNAIATRRSFLDKNRDTIKRFLQAYSEGIHQFMTNKEKAMGL